MHVHQTFNSLLYYVLDRRGIKTYIGNEFQKEVSSQLLMAIERTIISIIVLFENYSDSRWHLDELSKIFKCKEMVKQIALPLFCDIEMLDIRHESGSYGEAFAKFGALKFCL